MVGEIVGLVVLFAGLAIFATVAWRLSLHLIGLDSQELTMFRNRFRELRTPEPALGTSGAVTPAPATATGVAERVDRMLALLEDEPGSRNHD
jgi:hypothetical protein